MQDSRHPYLTLARKEALETAWIILDRDNCFTEDDCENLYRILNALLYIKTHHWPVLASMMELVRKGNSLDRT